MIYVLSFTSGAAPKTGLSPTIITYKKISDGSDVASPPSISEVGGGLYKFTATSTEALGVVVDGGATLSNAERYKVMQITPNDGSLDAAVSSRSLEAGGNVAAVKAKTDLLPSDPASNTQVNTRLSAAGYLAPDNTSITAIKAKTDNLPASPANETTVGAVKAKTDNLPGSPAAVGSAMTLTSAYDAAKNAAPESGGNLAAVKAKTDNLPAAPAVEDNVQGHVADALAAYDPPTRAEASADKDTVLEAVAALNGITVGEILNGNLSDSLSFPANSLADLVRKLFWVVCNRMVITDASGAVTAYKSDGETPAASGTITDNGATTERSKPTWP